VDEFLIFRLVLSVLSYTKQKNSETQRNSYFNTSISVVYHSEPLAKDWRNLIH